MAKWFDARNSLFGMLSRKPWWASAIIAAGLFGPVSLFSVQIALFAALPFMAISMYVAIRDLRKPSVASVVGALQALHKLSVENFSGVVEQAYLRQGYQVAPQGNTKDLVLTKNGYTTLVHLSRFKAAKIGAAQVEALLRDMQKGDHSRGVLICASEITAQARKAVGEHPVSVVDGAALVGLVGHQGKRWFSWHA